MSTGIVSEKLTEVLAKLFVDTGISIDIIPYIDLINDGGMDSITFIALIIEIEESFEVEMPDEWLEMERFRKFDDILRLVEELLN